MASALFDKINSNEALFSSCGSDVAGTRELRNDTPCRNQ